MKDIYDLLLENREAAIFVATIDQKTDFNVESTRKYYTKDMTPHQMIRTAAELMEKASSYLKQEPTELDKYIDSKILQALAVIDELNKINIYEYAEGSPGSLKEDAAAYANAMGLDGKDVDDIDPSTGEVLPKT
jgi:hypothetical protein